MGETTNSKIKSKIRSVYFNLDDEDELRLYEKAGKINFSKWVKKQLNGNDRVVLKEKRDVYIEEVKRDDKIDREDRIEIDSMMI